MSDVAAQFNYLSSSLLSLIRCCERLSTDCDHFAFNYLDQQRLHRHVLSGGSGFYFGQSKNDFGRRKTDFTLFTSQLLDSVLATLIRLSVLEIMDPQSMDFGRLVEK